MIGMLHVRVTNKRLNEKLSLPDSLKNDNEKGAIFGSFVIYDQGNFPMPYSSSNFLIGFLAGPSTTSPFIENLEPWQGQSHVRSPLFHSNSHPI
jgi:hypothetical protein